MNPLNSWGPILVDCQVFLLNSGDVISWKRRFSVSVRKLTLLKYVFVEDVNWWGRANHENWATTNNDDSTVFNLNVGYLLTLATCPLLHPFSVSIQSTKTISPIFKVYRSIGRVQLWPKSSNLISNCINSARDSSVTKHCHQERHREIHPLHEYTVSYVINYSNVLILGIGSQIRLYSQIHCQVIKIDTCNMNDILKINNVKI